MSNIRNNISYPKGKLVVVPCPAFQCYSRWSQLQSLHKCPTYQILGSLSGDVMGRSIEYKGISTILAAFQSPTHHTTVYRVTSAKHATKDRWEPHEQVFQVTTMTRFTFLNQIMQSVGLLSRRLSMTRGLWVMRAKHITCQDVLNETKHMLIQKYKQSIRVPSHLLVSTNCIVHLVFSNYWHLVGDLVNIAHWKPIIFICIHLTFKQWFDELSSIKQRL